MTVPRKSPIVKVTAWRSHPFGGAERWDLEVVREDGTRERAAGIRRDLVGRILEVASGATKARMA